MSNSKRTHDVVATVGEYTDRETGQKKKRFVNVGAAFTDPDGRVSIKLETVPVGPDWSGWLSLYPVKEREPAREHHRSTDRSPDW
jgi:hypothetical protein